MIAVLKGDIIASRKLKDSEIWLLPLKKLLSSWGKSPDQWEIVWGDSFQLEVDNVEEALTKAILIKALIKQISSNSNSTNMVALDVRISIGIGERTYQGVRVSESNGEAFINAGERFEKLRKEKITLAVKSPWLNFDRDMNLYIKLALTNMDRWSISSAELVFIVLSDPLITQDALGAKLGIKQNSVSGRYNRARIDDIKAVEAMYIHKLKTYLP
jgi:hypothetical protein